MVGRDWLSPDTNLFLFLCFQDSELLTFHLSGHRSWWEEHGPGCLHEKAATAGLGASHGQSLVVGAGCAMVYSYMEALHSGLQILLAVSVGSGTQAGVESGPFLHIEETGFLLVKQNCPHILQEVKESGWTSNLELVLVTILLLRRDTMANEILMKESIE